MIPPVVPAVALNFISYVLEARMKFFVSSRDPLMVEGAACGKYKSLWSIFTKAS